MAESNVNIMLDTVRRNRISVIYAVENDYGARFITATIMTDGKKKTIEGTAAVTINAERPDGQRKAFEGSVNEDGTVKVPVTQWMLEFEGEVVCSVSVVTSTSRLTTTHFYIQAQYSVWDGTSAPSTDDPNKDVIVSIIAAENERVANENARISTENARKTAETARTDAEIVRIANENIRVDNEAERVSAESVRKAEFASWQGAIGKVSAFDKRIENLEAAVSPGLVTPVVDDSVAYIKNVPTGALPNAMITEIGGMTRKCDNLISCAENFEFTKLASMAVTIPAGNYCLSTQGGTFGDLNRGCIRFYQNDKWLTLYADGGMQTVELTSEETQLYFYANGTSLAASEGVTATISQLMLNKGSTALPYEPYFEGLRDAKVTEIGSVGVNIWDEVWENGYIDTYGNNMSGYVDRIRSVNYIPCHPDTKYFVIGSAILVNLYTANKEFISQYWSESNKSFTTPKNCRYLRFATNASYGAEYKHDICINEYNEVINGTYYPYFEKNVSIPEAVQNIDGYGQGINKEYHNKIVLDPAIGVKKIVQCVGCVDLGTLDWTLNNANVFQSSTLGRIGEHLICSDYDFAGMVSGNADAYGKGDKKISIYGIDKRIYIRDDSYTNAAAFKNAVSGVMLVYVLETPIEVDISAYFGDDNLISVEGGGTVTMVNEYEYDVPSVIEYTVKGRDAT